MNKLCKSFLPTKLDRLFKTLSSYNSVRNNDMFTTRKELWFKCASRHLFRYGQLCLNAEGIMAKTFSRRSLKS